MRRSPSTSGGRRNPVAQPPPAESSTIKMRRLPVAEPLGIKHCAVARIVVAHPVQDLSEAVLQGRVKIRSSIFGMAIGQWTTQLMQANPKVTAELGLSSRPLHLIQEGCDVAILPGKITDESVIARPAGKITLELAASPSLVKERPPVSQ